MMPDHCHAAGLAKAERAINDLTDAAGQMGLADKLTVALVSLWDAFHPGRTPPLVRHKPLVLGKREPAFRKPRRGGRCNVERIESAEGDAVLQNVLLGLLSQHEAARKLDVPPTAVSQAVRRLRQERQRQLADASPETALSYR